MLWGLVIVGFFLMLSLEWPLSPSCSSSRPKGPLSSGGLTLKVRHQGWGLSGLSDGRGSGCGNQWPGGRAHAWDPSRIVLTCFFPSLRAVPLSGRGGCRGWRAGAGGSKGSRPRPAGRPLCAAHERRTALTFFNGWKESKENYFMTREHHMDSKVQCP